jgi:hypothetical protein
VRNCALGPTIQYSRDSAVIEPIGRGVLDVPPSRGMTEQPKIGLSRGFFAAGGLVFLHPIRFHCSSSGIPLIPE